jgi:hypothetical protein
MERDPREGLPTRLEHMYLQFTIIGWFSFFQIENGGEGPGICTFVGQILKFKEVVLIFNHESQIVKEPLKQLGFNT